MNTAESLEQLADQAARAGDAARAADCLERAAAIEPLRLSLWAKLSAMRRVTGDISSALLAIDRALEIDPLDFSALLARAFLLQQSGDPRSGEAFSNAIAQLPPDEQIPQAMRAAVAQAKEGSERFKAEQEARMTAAAKLGLASGDCDRIERFISNSARRTRHFHQEPSHFHFPGLPEVEFHEQRKFPQLAVLEAATATVRREFEALVACEAADIVPYIQYPDGAPLRQWQSLNRSKKWSALHLIQNGKVIEANAKHCPETMQLLAALPQPAIPTACPNAMFSLLAPRTRIPAHTGVANIRLVCHLPLIVPPNCAFRVGATTREWREGESFVFDDTIEHEAWNDSDQLRVVLIFDLWAPALSDEERAAVASIIPAAGVGFTGAL